MFLRRACPELNSSNSVGPELLTNLTAPCRYDRWELPGNKSGPVQVGVRLHVYFLGAIEAQSLVSDNRRARAHTALRRTDSLTDCTY